MEIEIHDFRHAHEILQNRFPWKELHEVANGITASDIVDRHAALANTGRVPAGGQTAVNRLFRERLEPLGWEAEPRLFAGTDLDLRRWKMDFVKDRVSVEVSFNHAEAVPWTFTRLNIAGESERVLAEHRIDVGVAFFAADSLKRWAKMDSAVGTFELARVWLDLMRPIMPIPVLVVGLMAEGWDATDSFRGTRQGTRGSQPIGTA